MLLGVVAQTERVRKDGLIENHAYSIMKAIDLHGEKLVQMRNPWVSWLVEAVALILRDAFNRNIYLVLSLFIFCYRVFVVCCKGLNKTRRRFPAEKVGRTCVSGDVRVVYEERDYYILFVVVAPTTCCVIRISFARSWLFL